MVEANTDVVYKDRDTKVQQEVTRQQITSKIANVKKDMIILEKSEFSALGAENAKIKLEPHQLKQVKDEVIEVRTDTKLDFNLEKSRVKELYSLKERKLLELRTEIVELHAQQDRALTQTDRKIETKVTGLTRDHAGGTQAPHDQVSSRAAVITTVITITVIAVAVVIVVIGLTAISEAPTGSLPFL
ncbi:Coiled-coil domain-containing protein 90A, mitochondrial [Heterocephalus glaber]|uniref:Coiled-coil domain-containing protein 90A, mitochondrial n=1 Tax=Heterocephalus glaber TaxID=10181 RepID=G5BSC4_HETGA|nr:Coiled-coil domain-containing protein 90A, mitochondrial [Heterocephalus glaber]